MKSLRTDDGCQVMAIAHMDFCSRSAKNGDFQQISDTQRAVTPTKFEGPKFPATNIPSFINFCYKDHKSH